MADAGKAVTGARPRVRPITLRDLLDCLLRTRARSCQNTVLMPGADSGILGVRAHAEFGIPVIGVAKSRFRRAAVRRRPAKPFLLYFMTAEMKLLTSASVVLQLFIHDTVVRLRSCV